MYSSSISNMRGSSVRDHRDCHYQSFSSTLLEEIYRSLDEERDGCKDRSSSGDQRLMTMKPTIKKSSSCYVDRFDVDKWIDNEKINLRRKLTQPLGAVVHSGVRRFEDRRQINHSSSTSSSDSSSGVGGFSSSDTESVHGSQKPPGILKPIRTAKNLAESHRKNYSDEIQSKKKKKQSKEGILQRRALKLYSELKKVKQPISPGGKLTSFLNSLFHSGAASKKPNISSPSSGVLKPERESPPTTSRSCLSKTPSSAGRIHRSVRFVDDNNNSLKLAGDPAEDHKKDTHRKYDVANRDSSILANDEEFKFQIKEKQRRVEEVAKELLRNYHHHNRKELKVNYIIPETQKFHSTHLLNKIRNFKENEDEHEDDEISCGSSDLFELENFPEIGMADGYYGEELPVYETTHVDTNRAIAKGFIL